jgi:hypothetical protein
MAAGRFLVGTMTLASSFAGSFAVDGMRPPRRESLTPSQVHRPSRRQGNTRSVIHQALIQALNEGLIGRYSCL